jgi:hypothetical protein
MVALACGVIGAIAILVAVLTGQASGMTSATAQVGFIRPPEPANTGTASPPLGSQPNKDCTQATWPFFDNDCLWGNTDSGTQERRRKRIVARLKSPWCSGLRSNDGAYFCRSRS